MTTPWQTEILKTFVQQISLTKQFTDSYDDFVNNRITETLGILKPIRSVSGDKWIEIRFSGGKLEEPAMLENDGTSRKILPMIDAG